MTEFSKSFEMIDLLSQPIQSPGPKLEQTVLEGLNKLEKRLPSWLIFDDEGSKLFEEITELEHYHPTVCEIEIFQRHKQAITELLPDEPFKIIELGSGDARKSRILLDFFVQNQFKFHYFPLDISAGAIENLTTSLRDRYQGSSMNVTGVVAHYFEGLKWILKDNPTRNLVFFLGSTIGNFDLPAAEQFLSSLRSALNSGDLTLIGFDLFKNPKLLYQAYNDPQGVFEKFNLHLLERINRELGANFNTKHFAQQGTFNWRTRAVESYLYSMKDQTIRIEALEREFHFKNREGLQTEHSYKYTIEEIETLAQDNGFQIIQHFLDSNQHYVDSIWKAI